MSSSYRALRDSRWGPVALGLAWWGALLVVTGAGGCEEPCEALGFFAAAGLAVLTMPVVVVLAWVGGRARGQGGAVARAGAWFLGLLLPLVTTVALLGDARASLWLAVGGIGLVATAVAAALAVRLAPSTG